MDFEISIVIVPMYSKDSKTWKSVNSSKCTYNFASVSIFMERNYQLVKDINDLSNTRISVLGRW